MSQSDTTSATHTQLNSRQPGASLSSLVSSLQRKSAKALFCSFALYSSFCSQLTVHPHQQSVVVILSQFAITCLSAITDTNVKRGITGPCGPHVCPGIYRYLKPCSFVVHVQHYTSQQRLVSCSCSSTKGDNMAKVYTIAFRQCIHCGDLTNGAVLRRTRFHNWFDICDDCADQRYLKANCLIEE